MRGSIALAQQTLARGSRFCVQAEDGIRDLTVTGVQTCALPILGKLAGSIDLLISTVNVKLDWDAMIGLLTPNGRLHVVGAVLEPIPVAAFSLIMQQRSEERRVGKECRSRWSPYH